MKARSPYSTEPVRGAYINVRPSLNVAYPPRRRTFSPRRFFGALEKGGSFPSWTPPTLPTSASPMAGVVRCMHAKEARSEFFGTGTLLMHEHLGTSFSASTDLYLVYLLSSHGRYIADGSVEKGAVGWNDDRVVAIPWMKRDGLGILLLSNLDSSLYELGDMW